MQFYPKKMLTVITEKALEDELIELIEADGAHGYTICDARGGGAHGAQRADWSEDANVRVDVIADEPTIVRLSRDIHQRYGEHYALIQFVSNVEVIRGHKF